MAITTFRVDSEMKEKLNHYTKVYNRRSVSEFIKLLLNYIERNEIDLNLDLNNGTYNTIKEFDQKIDFLDEKIQNEREILSQENLKALKRMEHLISVVKNIEKDYFLPLKEQGVLKVATDRELKEDLVYKKLVQENIIPNLYAIFSEKRKKDVYILDVFEAEYKRIMDHAK